MYNAALWLLDRHLDEGRGDRVAIRFHGASTTYTEVFDDAVRMQHALGELGVSPGERIAMVVNDEPGFVSLFLGAIRGGFVPVPLSTMLTASELTPIVADSGAVAVAVSAAYAGHLAPIAEMCPTVEHATQ